jgi:hypothetical protein
MSPKFVARGFPIPVGIKLVRCDIERMMRQMSPELTADAKATFEALQDEVIWLHAKWIVFRQLFGTSEERIDLLNDFGPDLFQIVYDGLLNDVLLTMSRLIDPARTLGKHNLSLAQMTSMIAAAGHKDLLMELKTLETQVNVGFAPFKDLRNRRIAHNDLGTALRYHQQPLPDITRQMIEDILKTIRDYMSAIESFFGETETDYREPQLRGDGDSLIYYLRKAHAYDRNRIEGNVNPVKDGLLADEF